ncbi:MAG: hypothetical protein JW757_06510 [Anaerolineales bacterium]|nr:hypothetical protein [Anaerolineales bacterium]
MKRTILAVSVMILLSLACATLTDGGNDANPNSSEGNIQPDATPTPTTIGGGDMGVEPSLVANRCSGLSGALEMQILVGPADAVGLPPVSMGEIPFSVVPEGEVYLVQGEGSVSYQETLTEAWGTYSVSFNMEGALFGECKGEPGNEALDITVEMSGEQMVEVRADGLQGDYPWSGTQSLDLSFPLEDGAAQEGEGWTFVLHLSN